MKNIILLLFFELSVYIFCNDSILSTFHQNGFKIRDTRTQLISYNEKYFNFLELKTFKYNRTTPAINATLKMKVTVLDKTEVVVQDYKFLSNEYRYFPIRFQLNLKKAVDSNAIGLGAIKKCGNLTTFSFQKGVIYHMCNFVPDESCYPPLIPNGKYKLDMKFMYLNEEIAFASFFGEVYTPIAIPKI